MAYSKCKSTYGLSSKLEMTENRSNELEDQSIEFTQLGQQRENIKRASGICRTITKDLKFILSEFHKEKKEIVELKKYPKKH